VLPPAIDLGFAVEAEDGVLVPVLRRADRRSLAELTGRYQELVELAFQQGTLAASEKEIILQIVGLDRQTAKDVMRPRSQMAAIPDDMPLEDMLAAARKHKHSRLPMYDETPDTIVGILNTRALLLNPKIDLADACLIRLADQFGTADILTLDQDFSIYRWGKNKPFRMLPSTDLHRRRENP